VVGDNSDAYCEGPNHHILGFDTEDGKGERIILKERAAYRKPLLTADGKRIVFNTFEDKKVHVVHFDGTGKREIADGALADVWRDPATGTDWVYYLVGPFEGELYAGKPLMRCQLDKPEIKEVIWDKTQANPDNFQLSRDGKTAAGLFPWNTAGTATLPNGTFTQTGNGCWTSIAPDNSGCMWVFDGQHKNVLFVPPGSATGKKIRMNGAERNKKWEVYHPRWSNHVRFIGLTGPYRVKKGHDAIHGGGPGINIFLGKFNESYSKIESWYEATTADNADFFPDLWVAGGDEANMGEVQSAPVVATAIDQWPGDATGMEFLFENKKKNDFIDPETNEQRFCRLAAKGQARYDRYLQLKLNKGYVTPSELGPDLLNDLIMSGELTFEFTITPDHEHNKGSVVLAQAESLTAGNFMIAYYQGQLDFLLSTSGQEFGSDTAVRCFKLPAGTPSHIVITVKDDVVSYYLNGKGEKFHGLEGSLISWHERPLVIGGLASGAFDFEGSLEGLAIYSRALSDGEALGHYQAYSKRFAERKPAERLSVQAKLTAITPTPDDIGAYSRGMCEYEYEVVGGDLPQDKIIVRHWTMFDRKKVDLKKKVGTEYALQLERIEDHPELEGERVTSGLDDPLLDVFFAVE
jgi:hypothetical protein